MPQQLIDPALRVELKTSYEEAINQVTGALKVEGFGVITEIDVKSTLKSKLDVDFRKYRILGACNPPLVHRALSSDLDIGLLLPCNVIVYEEDDGHIVVAVIDPASMLSMVDNPDMKAVALEARERLLRVVESLR
jgi:uncharacterized protein (DUF302 family)